ncbi:hypothetical protein [Marinilabilia sp.]|uniref:hypothetical protein n=1 Tax=Marinilabilia sp. TaxID=2021252 RepID=UPI0025C18297|nr:hypothetical protein [Marinilabilia sp.]
MKTSAIFTLIALTFTLTIKATNPSQEFLASLNKGYEENIEVADWMLNVEAFDTEVEIIEIEEWMTSFDQTIDPIIAIEDWMLNETLFTDYENLVKLEDWMLDESLFEDYEKTLAIKDWMLDAQAFTSEENNDTEVIELEDWMTNFDTFYAQF